MPNGNPKNSWDRCSNANPLTFCSALMILSSSQCCCPVGVKYWVARGFMDTQTNKAGVTISVQEC